MSSTHALTDFDEQHVIDDGPIRTIRAGHPETDGTVIIKQFDPDTAGFDKDHFRTVVERWAALADDTNHIQPPVDAGFVSDPWVAIDTTVGTTGYSNSPFEDLVVAVIAHAADTLSAAHSRGLYHLHLDPASFVFTTRDNPMRFVISGWETALTGLPQPSATTQWDGAHESPYLAPEQTNADTTITETDARVGDVYQLGMVAYTLLRFDAPDTRPTRSDIGAELSHGFPDHDTLTDAIATAVAPDPNNRYQSMAEFASTLRDVRVRM